MGLFDGKPLTRDELIEVEMRRGNTDRATLHDRKGRTIRHRPWAELVGPSPVDKTCGDCACLKGGKYFKCAKQVSTSGPGTDIRKKDPACRLFESKGGNDQDGVSTMTDLLIAQCPSCGHEWVERMQLPMNLTAAAMRIKAMSYCVKCGSHGAVMLTGEAFYEAKRRLQTEPA